MARRYYYKDEEIDVVYYCWYCDSKLKVWEDDMEKGLMHVKCLYCAKEISKLEKTVDDFDEVIEKLEKIVKIAHKNN